MDVKLINDASTASLLEVAHAAYRSGGELEAARLFHEVADRERAQGHSAAALNARLWMGNSLMWGGRHADALPVLLEVATCDCPEANPEWVYAAKTDCLALALFYAPASVCRQQFEAADAYLARLGKSPWRHRLELLKSSMLFKQGRFPEALTAGMQAYRLLKETRDGPRYIRSAYLKYIIMPLFFLRQKEALAGWALESEKIDPESLTERTQLRCIRLRLMRLQRLTGIEPPGLPEEARAAADLARQLCFTLDEIFEVGHALMLAGDWCTLQRLPLDQKSAMPFTQAAFAVDRQINLLRRKLRLEPWDPDLNWPPEMPKAITDSVEINVSEVQELQSSQAWLDNVARLEDRRLETSYYCEATNVRRRQWHGLLQAIRQGGKIRACSVISPSPSHADHENT